MIKWYIYLTPKKHTYVRIKSGIKLLLCNYFKIKKKDKQENNKKKKSLECSGNKKYEKLPLAV